MSNLLAEVLKSAVAGDAAGYPFEGMKKGHIDLHFKTGEEFPDTTRALKGNLDKWKKPGLYSSISQFLILFHLFREKNHINHDSLKRYLGKIPEITGSESLFFRNTDTAERQFIDTSIAGNSEGYRDYQSIRILPFVTAVSGLQCSEKSRFSETIDLVKLFTMDISTTASAILFYCLISGLLESRFTEGDFMDIINSNFSYALDQVGENQSLLFERGYNPDYISKEITAITESLTKSVNETSLNSSEKVIVNDENTRKSTNYTRATVNSPSLVLLYSILINHYDKGSERLIFNTSRLGGSTAVLTALTAMISQAYYRQDINSDYIGKIINRKQILKIIEVIADDGQLDKFHQIFMEAETSLTQKEIEEYTSKNKRTKTQKPKKPKKVKESDISRHVVESWTKIDKAKWKKEKRKMEHDDFDE